MDSKMYACEYDLHGKCKVECLRRDIYKKQKWFSGWVKPRDKPCTEECEDRERYKEISFL